MPALCWMAPEMPRAMYTFGCTVLPVWPTWWSALSQPESMVAREPPTTPPSTSASSSASLMPPSTSLLMPRPTDTM